MRSHDPIEFDHVAEQLRRQQLDLYSKTRSYQTISNPRFHQKTAHFAHIRDYYHTLTMAAYTSRVILHGSEEAVTIWADNFERAKGHRLVYGE